MLCQPDLCLWRCLHQPHVPTRSHPKQLPPLLLSSLLSTKLTTGFPFTLYILYQLTEADPVHTHQGENSGRRWHSFALPVHRFLLTGRPWTTVHSCWTFVSTSEQKCGLKGGISQGLWNCKIPCLKVPWSVGKWVLLLTQSHQRLRIDDKKPHLGFATALGPFLKGKIRSEFQTVAFRMSSLEDNLDKPFLCFVFISVCLIFLFCL